MGHFGSSWPRIVPCVEAHRVLGIVMGGCIQKKS